MNKAYTFCADCLRYFKNWKLHLVRHNDCKDKDCFLHVVGGVHKKGIALCKYANNLVRNKYDY